MTKTVKLNKTLPKFWILTRNDYHELDEAKLCYEELGLDIHYEELFDGYNYVGLFWIDKQTKEVKAAIKELEETYENYE